MRHAILSDIHANSDALSRVLSEARSAGAESLILLGDYVGYYYEPRAVIAALREWPHHAIRGNHDRMLLAARDDMAEADANRIRYGSAVDVALAELTSADWQWLQGLPESLDITIGRWRFKLCHGSPLDPDQYIYPDADKALLDRCSAVDADAVLMGHSHWPFLRPSRPWLLNPGSVGQPRDIGGLSSWCLFDDENGAVAFRRTEMDWMPLAEVASSRDPQLPRNAAILSRGRAGKI